MDGLERENPPYWPGGIPAHIRCHEHPIPWQQFDDEIQGWLLYLDVSVARCCRDKILADIDRARKIPCHGHQQMGPSTMVLITSYNSGVVSYPTGPP